MENCYDVKGFASHSEVDGIWKLLEQCPTDAILNFRKLEWPLDYSLHDGIEFHQEFHTKPAALSFIPCNGVDDIEVSLVP
jgi:hypothetical protein